MVIEAHLRDLHFEGFTFVPRHEAAQLQLALAQRDIGYMITDTKRGDYVRFSAHVTIDQIQDR